MNFGTPKYTLEINAGNVIPFIKALSSVLHESSKAIPDLPVIFCERHGFVPLKRIGKGYKIDRIRWRAIIKEHKKQCTH